MITQQTLFEPAKPKDEIAIMRLKEFEPPEGLYIAFSGGKDSTVILDLVRRSGVKYDAHYSLTTVDPPELVRFIKTFDDVEIHRPKQTMWQLIQENGIPPTGLMRYCCRILKETGGAGRVCVTGIRAQESTKRSKRRMIEACRQDETKTYLNVIIDWSESEVWEYIKERKLPYCSLYDEGFKRLGCIMCPMGNKKGMLRDAKRWPKFYQAYLHAFQKTLDLGKFKTAKTPEEIMHWWIYNPPKGDPDQTVMFD